jgi:hypothetical protein
MGMPALRGAPIFVRCEEAFLHAILSQMEPCIVCPGDLIIAQGDFATCAYFICSGQINYAAKGNNPKFVVPATTLSDGDSFCTYALVAPGTQNILFYILLLETRNFHIFLLMVCF